MIFAVLLEVMDKEAPLWYMWLVYPGLGVLALKVGSVRPWLAAMLALLILWIGSGQHGELTDPFVGPAILREAGRGYVVQSYLAIGIGLALALAGMVVGLTKRRR